LAVRKRKITGYGALRRAPAREAVTDVGDECRGGSGPGSSASCLPYKPSRESSTMRLPTRASRHCEVWILTLGFVVACGGDKPREQAFLPEPPYHGERTDIESAKRGNAAFENARFSPDGKFLVTFNIRNLQDPLLRISSGGDGKWKWQVQVWDAAD